MSASQLTDFTKFCSDAFALLQKAAADVSIAEKNKTEFEAALTVIAALLSHAFNEKSLRFSEVNALLDTIGLTKQAVFQQLLIGQQVYKDVFEQGSAAFFSKLPKINIADGRTPEEYNQVDDQWALYQQRISNKPISHPNSAIVRSNFVSKHQVELSALCLKKPTERLDDMARIFKESATILNIKTIDNFCKAAIRVSNKKLVEVVTSSDALIQVFFGKNQVKMDKKINRAFFAANNLVEINQLTANLKKENWYQLNSAATGFLLANRGGVTMEIPSPFERFIHWLESCISFKKTDSNNGSIPFVIATAAAKTLNHTDLVATSSTAAINENLSGLTADSIKRNQSSVFITAPQSPDPGTPPNLLMNISDSTGLPRELSVHETATFFMRRTQSHSNLPVLTPQGFGSTIRRQSSLA